MLWCTAQWEVTARLDLDEVILCDGELFTVFVYGLFFGCGMHATEVLSEEVFAVEVVVVDCVLVVWVGGGCAEIAAPVGKLDVLSADVSLPLVLGREVGCAAVCGKRAGEGSLVVVSSVCFHDDTSGSL